MNLASNLLNSDIFLAYEAIKNQNLNRPSTQNNEINKTHQQHVSKLQQQSPIDKWSTSYRCCVEEGGQGGNCADDSGEAGEVRKLIQRECAEFEGTQRRVNEWWVGEWEEVDLNNREWKLSAFLGGLTEIDNKLLRLELYTWITHLDNGLSTFLRTYERWTLLLILKESAIFLKKIILISSFVFSFDY